MSHKFGSELEKDKYPFDRQKEGGGERKRERASTSECKGEARAVVVPLRMKTGWKWRAWEKSMVEDLGRQAQSDCGVLLEAPAQRVMKSILEESYLEAKRL